MVVAEYLLTVPNQLGVDFGAYVAKSILWLVAPKPGWRWEPPIGRVGRNLPALMGIDDEVRVYEPVVHRDERGIFYESYNEVAFDAWVGREIRFVQDNHSVSAGGVLRGLHYQLEPVAQAKLVRVSRGSVFDVAVDIRRSSPTFGEWRGFELSAENNRQLWIPEGFAHGFLAHGGGAEVQYKTSAPYAPALDRAIRWDDPSIGIGWPLDGANPILGVRDAEAPTLSDTELFD